MTLPTTSGFHITCANKSIRGSIVRIGGVGWSLSLQEAIFKIVSEQIRLTILVGDTYFDINVAGAGSDAFLVLEPDQRPLDEVINLPSC